jgi:hypothetical protein
LSFADPKAFQLADQTSSSNFFSVSTANLQFRTLPRQHLGVQRNPSDSGTLVSVIQSPSGFMGGSIMGHHTIRRPTQSGLVETVPTSMPMNFYTRNPPLAINTSQHQQFFYG